MAPGSTLVRSTDIEMRHFLVVDQLFPSRTLRPLVRAGGDRARGISTTCSHSHLPSSTSRSSRRSKSLFFSFFFWMVALKSAGQTSCQLQSPNVVSLSSSRPVAFPPSAVARQSNVSKQQSGPAKKRPDLSLNPAVKSIYK